MALIDYVVLVPIWDEWKEVIPILARGVGHSASRNGRSYHVWTNPVQARHDADDAYLVAAVRMAIWTPGQSTAAAVTKESLVDWRPSRMVLVGIAGSLEPDKILLGDVVVPDMVYGYEIGDAIGRHTRAVRVTPSETNRLDLDAIINFRDDAIAYAAWQDECVRDSTRLGITPIRPPELHVTSTASGNEVVKSVAAGRQLRKRLKTQYVEAVEMEARGVDRAIYSEPNHPDALMVRGISDYADEDKQKLDAAARGGWRRYAAANAARLIAAYLARGPVSAISPPLSLDLATGDRDRFFAGDLPQEFEWQHVGAQHVSFPGLLRRSGSTPALTLTITAATADATPAADYRGIALVGDRSSDHRLVVWGTLSDRRIRFDIPDSERGYDLEMLLAFRETVARVEITCVDVFQRSVRTGIDSQEL